MEGTGTYIYSNGVKVSGDFKENRFVNGSYKIKNKNGKYTFTIKDGKAVHIYLKLKNKTVYDGEMRNGKLNGDAHIKYSNGDKYEGN